MQSADAIVVGSGAAGLMAARELTRAGKKVIVLEANNRVGGRILTLYDAGAGVPVELGAEFIHGEAPETTRLLNEAHLATVPVMGEHYRSDRGELSPQGVAWLRMKRVFDYLNPDRKQDRSFQEFLDDKPGGPALARDRQLARGFIQGFDGADTTLISEKALALQGDPTEGAAESRRVVNGYAALIEYLLRDVADVVQLNATVRRVIWDESGVRVFDQNGRQFSARTVIITVPLPMLQDASISIEPEIPALRNAAQHLVMGHVMRAVVIVKARFWEKKLEGLSFVHAPMRPINAWWTQHPIHAPVIVGWAGGPPAVELLKAGDVEGAVVGELARVFAMRRSRVEALIDSIHRHDWTLDQNIRGAYSYPGIGGAYSPHVLARPFGGTIFVAGEATDSELGGTVEGAIASAKRTTVKVLKRLAS